MTQLKRSNDRKVTNYVHVTKGGNATVGIANSIGLPSGRQFSCPDATDFCAKVCYAGKLEKVRKAVSAVLLHNWELLRGADLTSTVTLLSEMITDFVKDCEKRSAPKLFRIHWDGDFFSATYAAAWARVIRDFSDVQFWAYTRVQTAAVFLQAQRLDNLALYFSADPDNIEVARALEGKGILIAYVDTSFAEGKAQFPGAVRCPELNNRDFDLINEKGSACVRCGLCINGRKSVLFSTTKK